MAMVKPEDVLPYLWVLRSVSNSVKGPSRAIVGGGVCVHPSGIIITVSHALQMDGTIFAAPIVTADSYYNPLSDFRPATLLIDNAESLSLSSSFGLSLLKVTKVDDGEVFDAFDFPDTDTVEVEKGADVFTFAQEGGIPFTFLSAAACHSFPGLRNRSVGSIVTMRQDSTQLINEYISVFEPRSNAVKPGLLLSLSRINADVPLIQVNGFDRCTFDGQCGCPVFTEHHNKLIGLVSFAMGSSKFLIPAHILRLFLHQSLHFLGLPEPEIPSP